MLPCGCVPVSIRSTSSESVSVIVMVLWPLGVVLLSAGLLGLVGVVVLAAGLQLLLLVDEFLQVVLFEYLLESNTNILTI